MMTGEASIESAVRAMKEGAFDYLPKPFRTEMLLMKLERIFAWRDLTEENRRLRETHDQDIVGTCRPLLEFLKSLKSAADSEITLLLLGETGTGKELAADYVHKHSFRKDGPLIKVNCGAIPESLLEVELFGCVKGAYTGADRSRPGMLEQAHGGTLFLDEIGEIPTNMQVKLLRALQEKEITRIGGEKTSPADFRLVAATHRDLDELRDSGVIREDFFFRLNVVPLTIPPLRSRRADIPLLLNHFVARQAARHRKEPVQFAPETVELLQNYHFPGNVRELENLVGRLQVMLPGEILLPRHLPENIREATASNGSRIQCFRMELPLREAVRDFEVQFIKYVLAEEGGSRTNAARRLGISRKTLWEKLSEDVTDS
jgi:DNA-binding NtrC family response regulator